MTAFQDKTAGLQRHFEQAVGDILDRCETPQIQFEDGSWGDWDDLPIRLYLRSGRTISMAWSAFDTLWLSADQQLPFDIGITNVRWVEGRDIALTRAMGQRIASVWVGQSGYRPDLAAGLWRRVLIVLENGALEVFNALDEKGYAYHEVKPAGVWVDVFTGEPPE
ncbi:MAG: hypothetical protein AAGJ10_17730 [Bacteroidota bacterium]